MKLRTNIFRAFLPSVLLGFMWVQAAIGDDASSSPRMRDSSQAEPVQTALPKMIRVGIFHKRKSVSIGCPQGCVYVATAGGKPVKAGSGSTLGVKTGRKGVVVNKKLFSGGVRITTANEGNPLTVNGRAYRGALTVRRRGNGTLDVIEQIPLEEYLYGVLPKEVGADWPVEALKAQAVISRTFVLANMGRYAARGYDVSSDVYTQVYGGLKSEHPATNDAVDATKGEILVDDKQAPIQTFFHSSCGGRTETPRYVWQEVRESPLYFDSVLDPFCKDDPFYHWELRMSADALLRRLKRSGFRVSRPIKNIRVAKTTPSERVGSFAVDSGRGRTLISGNAFRLAVGPEALRSTLITNIQRVGKSFLFEGRGWGHGVGLCQYGARGRALAGHSYGTILNSYYPNVRLIKGVER